MKKRQHNSDSVHQIKIASLNLQRGYSFKSEINEFKKILNQCDIFRLQET